MKYFVLLCLLFMVLHSNDIFPQGPYGNKFGFGIVLGEPTGLTGKYWLKRDKAIVFDIGSSFFGSPRIDFNYLWHFNAFNSSVAKLYAGPGIALGLGDGKGYWYKWNKDKFYYRENNSIGLAATGSFGLNVIPRDTPLEIFLEAGILVGLAPDVGSAADLNVGIRFYP